MVHLDDIGEKVPSWTTVLVLCSLLVLHNAQRMAPVPLVDELRVRLGTDYAGAGNLFGAYMITYALFSIPAGLLADRVDARRLVAAGAILSLLGSALFAVANSYPLALLARLWLGMSGAFLYIPAVRYVVSSFPPGLRGRVMGFMEAGVGVGQILALTVVPFLALQLDVVQAFMALPLFAALVLVGILVGLRSVQKGPGGFGQPADAAGLARSIPFWYLLAFHFLGMLAIYSVSGWLPTFFRSEFGYSAVEAGLVGALANVTMAIFSPLAGAASDRLGSRTPVLLAGSVMLVVVLGVLMTVHNPWVALAASAIAGVAFAACIPVLVIMVGESFGQFGPGLAVSIAGTTGQVAASLSGPVFGYTLEVSHGFGAVWGLALALGAVRIPFLFAAGERKALKPRT